MNLIPVSLGLFALIMTIMIIAVNSIGIESYNKLKSIKSVDEGKQFVSSKKTNFNFLIFSLVCAILLIVVTCGMIIAGISQLYTATPFPYLTVKFGDAEI